MKTPAEYSPSLEIPVGVNKFLSILDSCFLRDTAIALPSQYSFAVSVACDINCPFCPRQTYGSTIESGLMSFDIVKHVAPYLEYSHYTGLFGLGEPFLHPRFIEFITTVKRAGGYAATSTHGMSLDRETIVELIDAGLDELEISIDAKNPKVFNFLRRGADLDTIIHNIKTLQEEKKHRGTTTPYVQVATVISVYNLEEVVPLVKLAEELEVDRIVFTNIIITHPQNRCLSIYPSLALTRAIEKAKSVGQKLDVDVQYFYQKPYPWQRYILTEGSREKERSQRYGCPLIWRSLYVALDGAVKPCCYYDDTFADCAREHPEQMFNNRHFRQLRRNLMGGNLPDCCVDCGNLKTVTHEYISARLDEAQRTLDEIEGIVVEEEYRTLKELLEQYTSAAREMMSTSTR